MTDEKVSFETWRSPPALDLVDLAVLEELLRDARSSQRSIARAVGMSAPAVGERIARLERAGVITGYRAVIDRSRLGFPVTAYLSVQTLETGSKPLRVATALTEIPEVDRVSVITGPMDLMVHLRVRDHEHLQRTLYTIWESTGCSAPRRCCRCRMPGAKTPTGSWSASFARSSRQRSARPDRDPASSELAVGAPIARLRCPEWAIGAPIALCTSSPAGCGTMCGVSTLPAELRQVPPESFVATRDARAGGCVKPVTARLRPRFGAFAGRRPPCGRSTSSPWWHPTV